MTLSSSPLPLSSLGETCISYLDSIATNLPASLRTLPDRFTTFASKSIYLEPSLRPFARLSSDEPFAGFPAAFTLTLVACLLAVAAMSWRQPFNNIWRRSPYSNVPTPQVSDSDYSYLTNDDIVDPPRTYGEQHVPTDDSAPDIILLKHLGITYPLHFPAYAIDDGVLTVGRLRQAAAEKTGASDPRRIKLLYKGKLLKDDSRPVKAEGLKQQSEVMCVVSEVPPGDTTQSDVSGSEAEKTSDSARLDGEHDARRGPRGDKKNKKKKNKKNKKKNKDEQPATLADPNSLAPPMDKQPSSSGRSAAPSPAPSLQGLRSPREQVDALGHYFRSTLLPPCNNYISNPPTDPKARDLEFRKLSETIMAQVLLKADGIEPDGDEGARNARRALIKEAQATLSKLDQAVNE